MFCHQCGAAIGGPDDRFCTRCGAQLRRGESAEAVAPGPGSPPADAPPEPVRGPVTPWPEGRRERIQLPLTELRQRRRRETGEAPAGREPGAAPPAESPGIEELGAEPPADGAGAATRAEAALRRMVPPREEWSAENRPAPVERARVRDEWPGPSAPAPAAAGAAAGPMPGETPPPSRPEPSRKDGDGEDAIIPWLEPPVVPAEPERPVPPSLEAKTEEGPIIVPRDYDENAARQRKGRRKKSPRARGPLFDPAALGRSIRPTWILAIAGVILLTLILFAFFPPGGGESAGTTPDGVNTYTGIPVHTIATPARPTPAASVSPTAGQGIPGLFPPTFGAPETASPAGTTPPSTAAGGTGIRVVISSDGGWSGTIGQQAGTYTETQVVGTGTEVRTITGPATMVTANIQKLDQTTAPLEVRVERDGVLVRRGVTTQPAGIVALSVAL